MIRCNHITQRHSANPHVQSFPYPVPTPPLLFALSHVLFAFPPHPTPQTQIENLFTDYLFHGTVVVLVYGQRQTVNMRMSRDQGLGVAFVVCILRLNGKEGFMARFFGH